MHGIKHCGYKSLSDMLADQNNMDGASENTEATNSQLWFHFLDKLYFIMSTIIPKKQTKQADSSDVLLSRKIYTKTLFFTLQSVHPNIQARTIDGKKH